jgi:hypothetical protein
MRVTKLARPGPIIIAIWLICYLIWAFYLPYEWVQAIQKFLFEIHLRPEIIQSLHPQDSFVNSLPIEFLLLGIFLLIAIAIGFGVDFIQLKLKALRDLF